MNIFIFQFQTSSNRGLLIFTESTLGRLGSLTALLECRVGNADPEDHLYSEIQFLDL